jgi:putative DNA primase/helicase
MNIEPLTEAALAEALSKKLQPSVVRVIHENRWLGWTADGWQDDSDEGLLYEAIIAEMRKAAPSQAPTGNHEQARNDKALLKLLLRHEDSTGLNALSRLLAKKLRLKHDPKCLDANLDIFGVANGTLDLVTGTIHDPEPSELVTRRSPVSFDPDATCPRWEDFLAEAISEDPEVLAYLQMVAGYCLTGRTSVEQMWILQGHGANGKSTFLNILRELFADYAETAAETLLTERGARSGNTNDIAMLTGKRLVTLTESDSNHYINEFRVKQLVSGEPMAARKLYHNLAPVTPVAKFFLATNHLPKVRGTDEGIWRRLVVVEFPNEFPNNPHLIDDLRAELPGILAWAVRGAVEWYRQERLLPVPALFRRYTDTYRHGQDHLRRFLHACAVLDPDARISAADLRLAYEAWCSSETITPLSRNEVGARLTRLRCSRRPYGKQHRDHWFGIRLTTPLAGTLET